MVADKNKGIRIVYNYLNLPILIGIDTNDAYRDTQDGEISYIYDAYGIKLAKIVQDQLEGSTITTSYAGGYIYENNNGNEELKMIPHPEGYVEPVYGTIKAIAKFSKQTQTATYSNYQYAFNYTDHLGNVRLTYADSDGDGAIEPQTEIISEKNYYPFGLQQKGYNNTVSSNNNSVAQNFTYNGKELQEELGLQLYDYGRRSFDPAIARFTTMDRFAEKYLDKSPYHYANNNPIIYVDKQGDSIKFAVARTYTGTSTGSTTSVTSNNDLGETYLTNNTGGGTYNATTKEVDATFKIRQKFSPFIDPNTKFKQNNPGLATEVEAHEDGHADQIRDEINTGTFDITVVDADGNKQQFTGSAQDILDNVYNANQTDMQNAITNKESYETEADIRTDYGKIGARQLSTATNLISDQAGTNVDTANAADPGHSDANNRATTALGGNVQYINGATQMVPCTTGNCN